MTWNKWLVFTKISYYVIEQHIKTDLARLALFDYREYYMTLFNTTIRYAELWRRGMSLAPRAVRPGFDTHR